MPGLSRARIEKAWLREARHMICSNTPRVLHFSAFHWATFTQIKQPLKYYSWHRPSSWKIIASLSHNFGPNSASCPPQGRSQDFCKGVPRFSACARAHTGVGWVACLSQHTLSTVGWLYQTILLAKEERCAVTAC